MIFIKLSSIVWYYLDLSQHITYSLHLNMVLKFRIKMLYTDVASVFQIDYMVPTIIADEMSYM